MLFSKKLLNLKRKNFYEGNFDKLHIIVILNVIMLYKNSVDSA